MVSRSICVLAALVLAGGWATSLCAEQPAIERWDRAICLVDTKIDKENNKKQHEWCTAFLVTDGEHVTMVASGHGARRTDRETAVVFRAASGDSCGVHLRQLYEGEGDPWHYHPNADAAVMRIEVGDNPKSPIRELLELAIPLENIQTKLPKRTTAIELTGYPMGMGIKGLGAQNEMSSIVVCGKIASREMPVPAKWGNESLFVIQIAGASGISGGPVFLAEESPESVQVVGMVMGYIREDPTGLMMSRIIPGRILVDAVNDAYAPSSP